VQLATALFALVTATLFALMLWLNDPGIPTMLAASSIALFCGVSAVLIMARFLQQPVLALDRAAISTIDLTCPRCRRRGPVDLGQSACGKCGLRFKIEVEEPRCAKCNQLLYGLTTDRCPECGTLITEPAIS
jgi:phage FluMu protein Com